MMVVSVIVVSMIVVMVVDLVIVMMSIMTFMMVGFAGWFVVQFMAWVLLISTTLGILMTVSLACPFLLATEGLKQVHLNLFSYYPFLTLLFCDGQFRHSLREWLLTILFLMFLSQQFVILPHFDLLQTLRELSLLSTRLSDALCLLPHL